MTRSYIWLATSAGLHLFPDSASTPDTPPPDDPRSASGAEGPAPNGDVSESDPGGSITDPRVAEILAAEQQAVDELESRARERRIYDIMDFCRGESFKEAGYYFDEERQIITRSIVQ